MTDEYTPVPYDFSKLYVPTDEELKNGIPQDTDHWMQARQGRITASKRAHQLLHSRDKTLNIMMDQMGLELQADSPDVWRGNKMTEHGHAFEDQAIAEYDMARLTDGKIRMTPGMFVHPLYDIASATPDFFVGDDTSGQVKCPYILKNHNELLHFGVYKVSKPYYTQVQFEAFVSGRSKIVFISYHPDATSTSQLHFENVPLDIAMHDKFAERLSLISHMLGNDQRFEVEKNACDLDSIPTLF